MLKISFDPFTCLINFKVIIFHNISPDTECDIVLVSQNTQSFNICTFWTFDFFETKVLDIFLFRLEVEDVMTLKRKHV